MWLVLVNFVEGDHSIGTCLCPCVVILLSSDSDVTVPVRMTSKRDCCDVDLDRVCCHVL